MAKLQEENKTYGQVGGKALLDLLLSFANSLNSVGPTVSKISSSTAKGTEGVLNAEVGQNPASAFSEAQKPFDPLHDARIKEATKIAKEEVRTAHEMGVPVDQIISMSDQFANNGIMTGVRNYGQIPVNPSAAMQNGMGGIATSQPQQSTQMTGQMQQPINVPQVNPAKGAFSMGGLQQDGSINQSGIGMAILQNILPAFFPNRTNESIAQKGALLDNAGKEQELTGQKPYQAGAREEQELKGSQAIQQARATNQAELNKPMSPEQGKVFSALMEGRDATNSISDMLLGGNDAGGLIVGNKITPAFFKSGKIRDYDSAIEIAIQAKTRAETGAALAPKELKNTSKRYRPRIGDSTENIKNRLKPLFGYFDKAIKVADPSGVHQGRASQTENQAALAQALIAEKKRRLGAK